jgi:hypothetical protein
MQARRYAEDSKLSSLPESLSNCTDLEELYVSSLPFKDSDPPPPRHSKTRINTLIWHTHIL